VVAAVIVCSLMGFPCAWVLVVLSGV
jgi:hypothetical protein